MSLAEADSSFARRQRQANMRLVPAGTFRMGSDKHYPEEAPVHRVTVDGFWMDRTPVTNLQFREFVEATGYVTFAEIAPDPKDYPSALPHTLRAGSLVFNPPDHQDEFPRENLASDGYARTSPVDTFPPNGFGLSDMIGDVWEWTTDWCPTGHTCDAPKTCCIPENPRGGIEADSYDPRQPRLRIPCKVVKGGSHLCAPNYCRRYRPPARHAQPIDTSMSHVGFRCVSREGDES
jgi:formylglycine-generating enzyme required for sulfatase activity